MMKPPRLHSHQRGIVSVAAAIILIAAVVFVLTQTYGIVGTSSQSHAQQMDSAAAFFLAESGLEQGQGKLRLAADPTAQSVCLTDIPGTSPTIGRGTFTLTTASTGCDVANLNCTSCTITSTGKVGGASRTVVSVISLSAPSGGAMGCGGGGTTPVVCPVPTTPAAYLNKDIVQSINVTTVPVILFSNMAYLRHPAGGANNVNAATGCVLLGPSASGCITEWNDESNTSAGNSVVGSRGASVLINTQGNYTFTQHLTADSLFAAVGAKFGATGGTLTISGSYWRDSGSGGTASNNATASGTTNNGAACATNDGSATCPNATSPPAPIPDPPSAGSAQTSRSWCYDADTLVLGFSGKSSTNNSGALTAFQLGTSPSSSVPSGLSIAAFPNPVAGTNSELYSAMRYIYNPTYLSANDVASGAVVTGQAGAIFTGQLTNGSNLMEVIAVTPGGRLSVGDVISGSSKLGGAGNTSTITAAPPLGLAGTYTLANNSSGNDTGPLTAKSTILYVTAAPRPYLDVNDTIFGTGISAGTTISSMFAGTTGGIGSYGLSGAPRQFASTAITSNGMAVSTPASTSITAPAAGTYVAERWTVARSTALAALPGVEVALAATPVAASPAPTATLFYLTARPTHPLSNAQLCGGICAFFNHKSASATTPFTIGITGTSQWAAGMTCLKGVDTGNIVTLTGASATAKATSWTEPVH